MRALPWVVAVLAAGVTMYLVDSGKFDNDENKFLGVFPLNVGIGADDFARGGVVVAGAVGLGMLAHKLSGGAVPQGAKV